MVRVEVVVRLTGWTQVDRRQSAACTGAQRVVKAVAVATTGPLEQARNARRTRHHLGRSGPILEQAANDLHLTRLHRIRASESASTLHESLVLDAVEEPRKLAT